MARTKQTAHKSTGGKAPRKALESARLAQTVASTVACRASYLPTESRVANESQVGSDERPVKAQTSAGPSRREGKEVKSRTQATPDRLVRAEMKKTRLARAKGTKADGMEVDGQAEADAKARREARRAVRELAKSLGGMSVDD